MKKKEKLGELKVLHDTMPPKVREAFNYGQEKQRLLWYTDKIPKYNWESVYCVDCNEYLIYSESVVAPKMGAKLYPSKQKKQGFTFDKTTRKVKFWYGSGINSMRFIHKLLETLGLEWVSNEHLNKWLTKTLFEKILSRSITNPTDACKHIIKTYRLKETSPEHLRQFIKTNGSKITLLAVKDAITDINAFLKLPKNEYLTIDLTKQAKALGRKFNWSWSERRLEEVHQQWTKELMAAELDLIEDEPVGWSNIQLPEGFEIINTKKALFSEGSDMSHCVYTNYWESVRTKQYMVLHITDNDGNQATAGLRLWRDSITVDQIKSKRNGYPPESITKMVHSLVVDQAFKTQVRNNLELFIDFETNNQLETLPY